MSKLKLSLISEVSKENGNLIIHRIFSIENAKNFKVLISKDNKFTEISFEDSTNYCFIEDAPFLLGVWEIIEQTENKIILKEK